MKKKLALLIFAIVIIGGIIGYNYLYQDHREIATEEPIAELTSESILEIFRQEDSSEILNATVTVKGKISEINETSITLDDKVSGSFSEIPGDMAIGMEVEIKGRCIGYDDLFELVKMDQCTILNN
ncbi:hypothetical protein J1N09_07620 [Aureitalea sp. L0-47]|uniref:hypothetical protein n=1 Tax=Aureitalea sp. L0-47 TaxID=2816962 RepID=UPI00223743B2|nr:hypothetical protein [Aureitalea sp. L0-47]MCW5519702.1 hypothetical protein [Aureitalea sp. L0-47]